MLDLSSSPKHAPELRRPTYSIQQFRQTLLIAVLAAAVFSSPVPANGQGEPPTIAEATAEAPPAETAPKQALGEQAPEEQAQKQPVTVTAEEPQAIASQPSALDDRRGLDRKKPPRSSPPTPEVKARHRWWTAEEQAEIPQHVRFARQPTTPTAELLTSAETLFGSASPYTVVLQTRRFLAHDVSQEGASLAPVLRALRTVTGDNREKFNRAEAQIGQRDPNEDFRDLKNLLGLDLIVALHQSGDLAAAIEVALLLVGDEPTNSGLVHEEFKLLHVVWSQADGTTAAARRLDEQLAVVEKKWHLRRAQVDLSASPASFRSGSRHDPVQRFLRRARHGTRDSGTWVRGQRRGDAQEALHFALAGLLLTRELHPEGIDTRTHLELQTAQTLDYLGHSALAEELLQDVHRQQEHRSDEEFKTLSRLHQAALYARNQRYEEAEQIYLDIEKRFRQDLAETSEERPWNRTLARIASSLGVLYDAMDRIVEADERFAAATPPAKEPRRPAPETPEEARQKVIEDGRRLERLFQSRSQSHIQSNSAPPPPPSPAPEPSLLERFGGGRGGGHTFEISHAALAAFHSQRGELELAHRHGVYAVEREQFNWHWEPLFGIHQTLADRQDSAGLERYRELLDGTYERVRATADDGDPSPLARSLARIYSELRDDERAATLTPQRVSLDVLVGQGRIEEAYERSLAANRRGLEARLRFPNGTGDTSAAQPWLYTLLADHPARLDPREAFLLHLSFRQSAANRTRRARHRLLQLSSNRDLQTILRDHAYRQGAWAQLFLQNLEPEPGGGFKATEISAFDIHMSREPGTIEELFKCAFYKHRPCTLHRQDAGATFLSDFIHGRVLDVYGSNGRWLHHSSDMQARKEVDPAYWNAFVEFLALDRREQIERSKELAAEFEVIHDRYQAWQALKLDLATLDAHLPSGSLYLDFGRYRRYDFDGRRPTDRWHYFVFAYRPGSGGTEGSLEFVDLGPVETIKALLKRLRTTINRGRSEDLDAIRTQAGDLYRKLLGALEPQVEASRVMVVAAEGSLHLLPFEVLIRPDGRYLADSHSVVYSHASDWLDDAFWRTLPSPGEPTPGYIFAAPEYDDQANGAPGAEKNLRPSHFWPPTFPALEFAGKEGQTIAKLARRGDTLLLTGAEATELRLRALTRPDFLHFATHGFFFAGAELPSQGVAPRERRLTYLSGLALAGANGLAGDAATRPADVSPSRQRMVSPSRHDDGILTAAEVESLLLAGTRLVVLSACETGVGDTLEEIDPTRGQKIGEGVASLRRAFRTAGAEHVIMSFWDLDDEMTPLFMNELYRHVFRGTSPARALVLARQAVRRQLVARHGFDHPFYWAALGLDTATVEGLVP